MCLRAFTGPLIAVLALCLLATACSLDPGTSFSASSDTDNSQVGDSDASGDSGVTEFSGDGQTATSIPELAFIDGPRTLRVGLPTLDFVAPHELDETDPSAVLVTDLLTDGLTELNSFSGLIEPALAESWDVSPDGLTWTFALGEYSFSDGTPITAADVVASLERVAVRGIGSLSGPTLWPIVGWVDVNAADSEVETGSIVSGLVAVDERTVEINLTEPFAALPDVLAGVVFGIYPAEPAGADDLPMASSRDFEPVALWEDGVRVQRIDDADEARIGVVELYIDDEGTLLEAGEVDMTIDLDPSDPLRDLRSSLSPRSAHVFFAMDATEAPFDDPLIRQAVLHAVDMEAIRSQHFPNDLLMRSFGGLVGDNRDNCALACELDLDEAQLLVDASTSGDVGFTVDYFGLPAAEDAGDDAKSIEQRVAEVVAEQLQALGLDATAQGHEPAEYGTLAATGELDLFLFGSVTTAPTPEATVAALFGSFGYDNITGTSIDRLDELIAEARDEQNGELRRADYASAEQVAFGEGVVLPLVTLQHHVRFTDQLRAAGLEPDGSLDLNAIEFANG